MLSKVDHFFAKEYHPQNYNCSHFANELYEYLTGLSVGRFLLAFNSGTSVERLVARHDITRIDAAVDPCWIWFSRPKDPPHVGVYVNGGVFHMTPEGPVHQPVSEVAHYYDQVKYYHASIRDNQ